MTDFEGVPDPEFNGQGLESGNDDSRIPTRFIIGVSLLAGGISTGLITGYTGYDGPILPHLVGLEKVAVVTLDGLIAYAGIRIVRNSGSETS